mgnify:CR=1 FL=1
MVALRAHCSARTAQLSAASGVHHRGEIWRKVARELDKPLDGRTRTARALVRRAVALQADELVHSSAQASGRAPHAAESGRLPNVMSSEGERETGRRAGRGDQGERGPVSRKRL